MAASCGHNSGCAGARPALAQVVATWLASLLVLAGHLAEHPAASAAAADAEQGQLPLPPTPPSKQDLAAYAHSPTPSKHLPICCTPFPQLLACQIARSLSPRDRDCAVKLAGQGCKLKRGCAWPDAPVWGGYLRGTHA
jgi:hypothetical protein